VGAIGPCGGRGQAAYGSSAAAGQVYRPAQRPVERGRGWSEALRPRVPKLELGNQAVPSVPSSSLILGPKLQPHPRSQAAASPSVPSCSLTLGPKLQLGTALGSASLAVERNSRSAGSQAGAWEPGHPAGRGPVIAESRYHIWICAGFPVASCRLPGPTFAGWRPEGKTVSADFLDSAEPADRCDFQERPVGRDARVRGKESPEHENCMGCGACGGCVDRPVGMPHSRRAPLRSGAFGQLLAGPRNVPKLWGRGTSGGGTPGEAPRPVVRSRATLRRGRLSLLHGAWAARFPGPPAGPHWALTPLLA